MSGDLNIRTAVAPDAEAFQRLHTDSVRTLCSDRYTPEQIEGWLRNRSPEGYLEGIERGEMFIAEIDGKAVGFGHAAPGRIWGVFVDPHFAGQGIGSKLLLRGVERASKAKSCSVELQATLNAVGFYQKFGFVEVEEQTIRRNGVDLPFILMKK